MQYGGVIYAPYEDREELAELGVDLGPWVSGTFILCCASEETLDALGRRYRWEWSFTSINEAEGA